MRTAPALQVTVARYGLWRGALLGLAVAATAAVTLWWATAGVPAAAGASVLLGTLLLSGWLLRAEWRRPPCVLRWDGQCWHWGTPGAPAARHGSGRVVVTLDLGSWMLLRLVPDGADRRRRARAAWLPVQARGLEPHWHALRCAVYSPTPAATSAGPATSPHA